MLMAMSGPGLFAVVVIGLLAGVAARVVIGGRRSMFACLLTGLAGAVLGPAVGTLLGLEIEGVAAFALATLIGATGLLAVGALIPRR